MNPYDSSSESEDEGGRRPPHLKPRVNFAQITDPQQCLEKFRMCVEAIEYVLQVIGRDLQHNTEKNRALTPQQQLLKALHWLGNGAQYHGVADMHGLHKSKSSVRKLLLSSFRRKSAGQPVKHLPLFLSNLWLF
ncbi:hypothetical protein ILUMI_06748 [Ignelater luminosus]|uniref:Uncharacterized protein n=1 Tax=Ignelater luminosus TaxID=2038154 RepID=A0A8K0D556_IGNLU|nr:hypothetical protein ILUMI_06748 [Ignelater luminosus]